MALSFSAFVTDLRASLSKAGYPNLHRSFGYVARNLSEAGSLTLTELAHRLGITTPGALKIVQSIEADGYIERVPDPNDARAKRLRLSKRGQKALAAARAFHHQAETELIARHGARKVAVFREVLAEMIEHHKVESVAKSTDDPPLFLRPM